MFSHSFNTLSAPRRRYLLSLLLGFCLILLNAAPAAAAPDYVTDYYPVINEAELSIIEQDYAAALNAYQYAFAAVPSPFARDYYNAAICALLLQNEKQTYEYLEKLVEKGVSLEYLAQQPLLDSLAGTRHWKKFRRKYKKRRRAYEEHVKPDLRANLDELYARDQYFRQAEGGLRVYGDTIRKIEAANVQLLLDWVEQYGYPGEDLIGVADTLEQLPRFTIVIQRQTKARKGYDFSPILRDAVHHGQLAPQAAAYLLEQQAGRSTYGSKAFVRVNCSACQEDKKKPKYLGRYLLESRSEAEQQRVDAQRKALGLEALEDYRKKVLYNLNDNRFKLDYTWSVADYYAPSSEAASVLMQRLVVPE
ncbi:hypothetical protein I2I11_18190 [Pontibacter sp. 172403-2]|uniref:hypothetical protein n=1 Tax=Pontibacter rufus TaxID=2791028 RepID=UPI0018AFE02F|nr:hypothetical protein [Pontibacter sp. 172403-2]MBF9255233.1 hypothetical protein [Pontibacter sp. 172403-2]